jgi:hypothetical protein
VIRQRLAVSLLAAVPVLLGLCGAWSLSVHQLHLLEGRENDPNPVQARAVSGLHRSLQRPLPFRRVVVDAIPHPNGRKPKVVIDPDGDGGVVGAQDGPNGYALYRPGHPPAIINRYSGGIGAEDAQAADLDGDHAPDIVVGGLDNVTFVLRNPRGTRCPDVYRCGWRRIVLDRVHPSHDVIVGDVDGNGRTDVITESGVYFNDNTQHWPFAGRRLIARDGQGTSLGDVKGDGILDIVAPYRSGSVLARFSNPRRHGGDPSRDVWNADVIDEHPRFTGNMTTAIGDVNGDGRPDIVMAPMYGGGGLVWYEGPPPGSHVWRRHLIDPTVNFVHQGSLQLADFNGDRHSDIAFAEQDQSPTRRVGIFYNVGGRAAAWRLQVLGLNGGHNIKVGRLGRDGTPSIVSARHGYGGGKNPLIAWKPGTN